MYCGLEKRCRHRECTSVPKRPQQSRADSPVAAAVASDTVAGLSSGPSGANGKSVMPLPVGCSRVSGLLTRRLRQLALMKSVDRIPTLFGAHEAPGPRRFLRSQVRQVCHHVSPPCTPLLTTVMHPVKRDFGYMAGGSDVGLVAREYRQTIRQTIRATKLATAEVGTPRAVAALTLLALFLNTSLGSKATTSPANPARDRTFFPLRFQQFNLICRFTDTITGYHVLPIGIVYSRCSVTWHMPRPARTSALTHSIDSQEHGNMRCWAYGSDSMCDR
jgi:hypothetical protein